MEQNIQKKIPLRECLGCGERLPKKELIRVLRTPEGKIEIDLTGKKSGRGAYLCGKAECLRKARKSRRLEKNLGMSIPDEIYASLEAELS